MIMRYFQYISLFQTLHVFSNLENAKYVQFQFYITEDCLTQLTRKIKNLQIILVQYYQSHDKKIYIKAASK